MAWRGRHSGSLCSLGFGIFFVAASWQALQVRSNSAVVSVPISLALQMNNVGITDDATRNAGNVDGRGGSYAARALVAKGLLPARTFQVRGVTFSWPSAAPGRAGNMEAHGQSLRLSPPLAGTAIALLGTATGATTSASAVIGYQDGRQQTVSLSFSDWTLNGGTARPAFGNDIAFSMPYHNLRGQGPVVQPTYIYFAQASVRAGTAIASITFPAPRVGQVHIFALSLMGVQPGSGQIIVRAAATARSIVTSVPPTATTPATAQVPMPTATPAPQPGIALGATIVGRGDFPAGIDAYNALVYPNGSSRTAAVSIFRNWDSQPPFPADSLNVIASRGAMPFLTWQTCGSMPACSNAAIASGSFDTYVRQFAHDAAAYGKPFYLRFDHEMNGTWYPWHPGNNGNTGDSYVAMWRHVHDIFAQAGVTNARWVWCPNVLPAGDDFRPLYPGDGYVDDLCLDGYNWGQNAQGSGWHSFTDIFAGSYAEITSISAKPVLIGEASSAEIGGDKAAWILQAMRDLPSGFPRVTALLWFDANKEADWRVDSSPATLAAYRQLAASPQFQGRLP